MYSSTGENAHLSQQAFVFGEQASAVLHGYVQSPPVEFHEGNGELKPVGAEPGQACLQLTASVLLLSRTNARTHVWS